MRRQEERPLPFPLGTKMEISPEVSDTTGRLGGTGTAARKTREIPGAPSPPDAHTQTRTHSDAVAHSLTLTSGSH